MSDEEWGQDYEKDLELIETNDKWEGEDEEDSVKDNWDDDEEEDGKSVKPVVEAVKKKRTLKEKITEKEEAKKAELREKLQKQKREEDMKDPVKAQDEKIRVKKMQEEADLELALEAFGLSESDSKKLGPIELSMPHTKEEFAKFSQLIYEKVIKYKDSRFFIQFIENVFRDLTLGVEPESIKKLSTSLSALYNEKLKLSKLQKNKKNKKTIGDISDKNEFADFADYM